MSDTRVKPAVIVLDALLAGQAVELGDYKYRVIGNRVHIIGEKVTATGSVDMPFPVTHVELGFFIRECAKVSEDDLFLIGSQTVHMQGVR